MDREKAQIGAYVTLEHPSHEMAKEATAAGFTCKRAKRQRKGGKTGTGTLV